MELIHQQPFQYSNGCHYSRSIANTGVLHAFAAAGLLILPEGYLVLCLTVRQHLQGEKQLMRFSLINAK